MIRRISLIFILSFCSQLLAQSVKKEELAISPKDIVLQAVVYWRGDSSYTESNMLIHRDSYEKSLSLKAWTKGRTLSLARFTMPEKDRGNATLMKEEDVWSYSPRTGKTVRIPPSMKAQSWMGSDFSYQELAKDDDIIDKYQHSLIKTDTREGKKVYYIKSVPLEDAPIVWGFEELDIREDSIILEHRFYDQDALLVKKIVTTEIGPIGGRIYPIRARMLVEGSEDWTEIHYTAADFNPILEETIFSLNSLENGS